MTALVVLILFTSFKFSHCSYHWIVTECGRIQQKLDSAFPVHRSYDLPALLDQEKRVLALGEMNQKMLQLKASMDEQWSVIELDNEYERVLYATDPDCRHDDDPGFRYKFKPVFLDFPRRDRPKMSDDRQNESPPDCRKYHKLDFSLLTFPHLKSLRDSTNISNTVNELESVARLDIDIGAMLAANRTDWTAYNLAVRYWEVRGNGTNAIECARRAIYFAPPCYRHFALFNLGTLLHAMESFGEAAIVLHTAVDLDRGYYRSHVALGHVYLFLNDYARAVGCYENALSLRPDLAVLAKLRASVLCYQKLINGLAAIDTELKEMIEDLKTYTKLQEQWVWTNTQIGMERACGIINTPSIDSLRTLWKKVEKQTMLLAERMTSAQAFLEEGAEHPARTLAKKQEADRILEKTLEVTDTDVKPKEEVKSELKEKKPSAKLDSEKAREKAYRRKVSDFYTFMHHMSYRHDITEEKLKILIIEKLVALQNDFKGEQPQDGPYWEIVRRCSNHDENDVLLFECGHKIFADYIELVNSKDKPNPLPLTNLENFYDDFEDEPQELLDESTIENYVEENFIHDGSEL